MYFSIAKYGPSIELSTYSTKAESPQAKSDVKSILNILDNFKLEDMVTENNQRDEGQAESGVTQGDCLNQIKAMRRRVRGATTGVYVYT